MERMPDQVTRNNHYVPQWYQRGFLELGQSQLHYLDKSPGEKVLADGRTVPMYAAVRELGPRKCFSEYDLYSTHFGPVVNDEVERFLFGNLDVRGAKAVRAFAAGDLSEMHERFQDFFEYLDAQKLRTPKGLDWIKSRYALLDQMQLMLEMQGLRLMHCTMWAEGVREIVSAEESDVKFIVSDHPVTIYNAAVPPASPECRYPGDPPIEWLGSQTVFVLDANTCLILTHLEYAKDPRGVNLTAPRTHARFRGTGMARTDNFIRTRKLSPEEVITINNLLKSRARKHVAASKEEWLYPEKSFAGAWKDIAQVLLPRDDLWQFGGDMYVGYEDGSTYFQDAFGRTSGAHAYLRKKRGKAPGPNDLCGCGSGHKYKHCCKDLPQADRPTWDFFSIRERNLMFCHAVQDILGLQSGKTWDDVRRELSDDQVKRIHEAFASLWPEDTDLSELLPRPQRGTLRAVYLGVSDPRTVEAAVLGWLPYFDQLILANPFVNPLRVRPKFSPAKSPSQHKAQTLKSVLLLLLLEPYIRAGYVHLIPDPSDINSQFGTSMFQMAEQRTAGWRPDRGGMGLIETMGKDDYQRSMRQLPERSLKRLIRQHTPDIPDADLDAVITYMKSEHAADPYALLQPLEPGEEGAQLQCLKGYCLESAMYLASLTGSAIYTDAKAQWQQLHTHAQQGDRAENAAWTPVVESLRAIEFPININAQVVYEALQAGRVVSMKAVLRRFAEAVQQSGDGPQPDQIAQQFAKASQVMQGEWGGMEDALCIAGHVELSVPAGGFERNEVRRLLLTFGRAKSVRSIPFAMFISLGAPAATEG